MIPIRPTSRPYVSGLALYFGYIAMFSLAVGTAIALVAFSLMLCMATGLAPVGTLYVWPHGILRAEFLIVLFVPIAQWRAHWNLLTQASPISWSLMASCWLRGLGVYLAVAGSTTIAFYLCAMYVRPMFFWYLLAQLVTWATVMSILNTVLSYEQSAPTRGVTILPMASASKHFSSPGNHNPWR